MLRLIHLCKTPPDPARPHDLGRTRQNCQVAGQSSSLERGELLVTKLLSHKPKTDPALARYPQALAELLTFGEPEEEIDYTDWADELGDQVQT